MTARGSIAATAVEPSAPRPPPLRLRIPAMDCMVEEAQIRRLLQPLPGITRLRFDLPARQLDIDAPADAQAAILAAVRGAGFEVRAIGANPPTPRMPPATARMPADAGILGSTCCATPGTAVPSPTDGTPAAAGTPGPAAEADAALDAGAIRRRDRRAMQRAFAALILAAGAELLHLLAPDSLPWRVSGMAVAAAAIALSGLAVFHRGWVALRHGRLDIQALMSVAVTGAFLIGQWPEAAMVMALYTLAERIEARSVARARHAIQGLLTLAPPQAEVQQADGRWRVQPAAQVPRGTRVRVRPGQRLPLDGRVVAGRSAVDQSPVTGESLPVDKTVGDEVWAGTINQHGTLEFEVRCAADETVLARILQVVEDAQSRQAPIQRFIDRFAARYTPAVFVLALGVAVGGPLLAGLTPLQAIYKALVLLVIACPCALVLSTPVTVVSALAAAARRGILIKDGAHLEQARRLRCVAFDKTGTLTTGRPRLVGAVLTSTSGSTAPVAGRPDGADEGAHASAADADRTGAADEVGPERVVGTRLDEGGAAAAMSPLRIARALAERSDHPVSRAIAQGLTEGGSADAGTAVAGIEGLTGPVTAGPVEVTDVRAEPGQGVEGRIGGQLWRLGRLGWSAPQAPVDLKDAEPAPALAAASAGVAPAGTAPLDPATGAAWPRRYRDWQREGRSLTVLAVDGEVRAVLAVADTVRPESREAVAALAALGIRTVMLSGDQAASAQAIAREVGIDEVRAGLLPQDKWRAVEALREQGPTAMVGDGINDGPALSAATVGFGMGAGGTDLALEAADVLVMNDDLRQVAHTVRLSRRMHAVLWQNIALALGIKGLVLVLALADQATMWMAVFADMGASLLVVGNGLRLLRAADGPR